MSFSFAELKKNSKSLTEQLIASVEKTTAKKTFEKEEDSRFWTIDLDEGGTAFAKIRFLPMKSENGGAYVKVINYAFKGPMDDEGKQNWYINESLQTIGLDDPVQKYSNSLYAKTKATGDKSYENQAKKLNRNSFYISNILVLQDKNNPENEGKTFLWRYGQIIFDKIKDKLTPPPEFDEPKVNIFDFWEGADFKVKISEKNYPDKTTGETKKGRDWTKCEFDSPSALFGGDEEKLAKLFDQQHDLFEFINPENEKFKPYDELLARLEKVMNVEPGSLFKTPNKEVSVSKSTLKEKLDDDMDKIMEKKPDKKTPETVSEDEEIDFFKSLADDD